MYKNIIMCMILLLICSCTSTKKTENEFRNPLIHPFSSTSIWNMPIGSNAVYIHAKLEKAKKITVDEDYIVMTPKAPLMDLYKSNAGWDKNKSRCEHNGEMLFKAPIPYDWIVSKETWDGIVPNAGLAVLMPDGRTIKQTQPFAHCDSGKVATSQYLFADEDIYGDGIYGAHGGSGLSAIGGTLRVGELTPESGPIRHALKINVFAKKNLYYDEETKGCRWPAKVADGYASQNYYIDRTLPKVKACRMGALLALPSFIDLDTLLFETKPARILAQAFQDYGAYIVDDTAWDVNAIITEWGPAGRFTEEFEKNWGFSMVQDMDTPWGRDMEKIFSNLHVVDNNGPESIGGGGEPRQPLLPELKEPQK